MRILIVVYSFTGNNRLLARDLARRLGAEVAEVETVGQVAFMRMDGHRASLASRGARRRASRSRGETPGLAKGEDGAQEKTRTSTPYSGTRT